MADALVSKSDEVILVWVQIPPSVFKEDLDKLLSVACKSWGSSAAVVLYLPLITSLF